MKQNVPLLPLDQIREWKKIGIIALACFLVLTAATVAQAQPVVLEQLASGSTNFTVSNGKLYYSNADSLFTSDGTAAGTAFVKKTNETILRISNASAGNTIFFVTQTGGQESLWKSDGTAAGTIKVATYNSIQPIISYQNELYLRINNGTNGYEPWKLSSSGSLIMLQDINPGAANGVGNAFAISGNILYFIGFADAHGDLWKTDGTPSGTVQAADLPPADSEFPGSFNGLTDANGTMFMTRTYHGYDRQVAELWKSDGTDATTVLVKMFDDDSYSYNDLQHLTAFKGKLYFIRNYGVPYHDLWVSDGTEAGTVSLKTVNIDGYVGPIVQTNDHMAFDTNSQGFPGSIFKSDGTAAGTQDFHDLSWYLYGDFVELTATPDLAFFVDDIREGSSPAPDGSLQLWQANLNSGHAVTLKELYGTSLEGSDNIRAAGSSIFFTTNNDGAFKLWYYNPAGAPLCAGTGNILRELWLGVQGNSVSDIPVDAHRNRRQFVTSFETQTNYADHYGSRIRGYLCVPKSGKYRFWIASNDNSELWLSTTSYPADKVRIAFVNGFTNVRQYDKYPSQQSALIDLIAGQFYYIEALHKEGVGSDHLSVGMQLPDGTMERPIPGIRLFPYDDEPVARPIQASFTSPQDGQVFTAPATVNFHVNVTDHFPISKVEFYRNGVKLGYDVTAPYTFTWSNVPVGSYTVVADAFNVHGGVGSDTVRFTVVSAATTARMAEAGDVYLKPNPAKSGTVNVAFLGNDLSGKDKEVYIKVVSSMGKVMYSGPSLCDKDCNEVQFEITGDYRPGVYLVSGTVNGKTFSRRLLIQ